MSERGRRLLFSFAIEMVVYGVLLLVYFLLVLRFLGQPLYQLFNLNPWVYAGATLLLIVAQGVLLEAVTSFLLVRLGLEKLE